MKKKCLVLLIFLSLVICVVPVWAEDTVWIPDDPFYAEHAEECVHHGREYTANGPNGEIIMYESPTSSVAIKTVKNGEVLLADYIYTNSENVDWGYCEYKGVNAWVPMPYLVLVYDYISFAEEYKDQIQEASGSVEIKPDRDDNVMLLFETHTIQLWNYPGSENGYDITYDDWRKSKMKYTCTFLDENGRNWGFVSKFLGDSINMWVYLDDPEAALEELYPNGIPKRDNTAVEAYEGEEIFPDDYEQVELMHKIKTAGVIAGVVLCTAAIGLLYWKLWKKIQEA